MTRVLLVFGENFELVALTLQPFDATRQYDFEFVDAAKGVVEGDDGTVARVSLDVFQHVFGGDVFGVVARNEIPHDDGVVAAQTDVLCVAHPSARWAEEVGVYELVGLVGVA